MAHDCVPETGNHGVPCKRRKNLLTNNLGVFSIFFLIPNPEVLRVLTLYST
jgi:hypothetical protein